MDAGGQSQTLGHGLYRKWEEKVSSKVAINLFDIIRYNKCTIAFFAAIDSIELHTKVCDSTVVTEQSLPTTRS